MIVGVCGYARHGKGEVGRRLVERHGFEEFQFSAALKEMALRLDPLVRVDHEDWVRAPIPRWTTYERLSDIVNELGWDDAKMIPEARRILQALGTECVRDILGEDSWIRALARKVEDVHHAVVTDLRFPNEAEWVRSEGGVIVRVIRPNFENGVDPSHPSEASVDSIDVDYEVVNDGALEDLGRQVDRVVTNGLVRIEVTAYGDTEPQYVHSTCHPDCQTNRDDGLTVDTFHDDGIERPGDAVARCVNDCE